MNRKAVTGFALLNTAVRELNWVSFHGQCPQHDLPVKTLMGTTGQHLILRLDITGQPQKWIPWQQAVVLSCREMIAWQAGETDFTFCGGINRKAGIRSSVTVSSIVAIKGAARHNVLQSQVPPLSNRELFLRDANLCLYCGKQYSDGNLTRDHLMPLSRGGADTWNNVVSACRSCNHLKGARTPEEAGMTLLAVPYEPNRAEYLVLSNRRILADQMEFLKKRFRRNSRLRGAS